MSKAPTPSYSKAKRPYLQGTYEQPSFEIGGDIIIPEGGFGPSDVEVLPGNSITVDNLSNSTKASFRVHYSPYVALDVNLTLIAKRSGVIKPNPVLKGTIIDVIELDWTRNKPVSTQTLTNNGGLVPPSLAPSALSHDYVSQSVSADIIFTLTGNDGQSQSGSIDSSQASILFGNNMVLGADINRLGLSTAGLVTAAASMTKVVKTSRIHNYFATGGVNQHHYVLYPKSYGLATFTKGIFVGGYVRLMNVAGVLKSVLGGGDIESDILITNTEGFQEAYYAYMTLYDNQNDPVTPFVIS